MVIDQTEFESWLVRYSSLLDDYAKCGAEHYFWLKSDAVRGTEQAPELLRVKMLRFADGRVKVVQSQRLNQTSAGPTVPEPPQKDDADMVDWFLRNLQLRLQQGAGIWQANREY